MVCSTLIGKVGVFLYIAPGYIYIANLALATCFTK